jgi:hypothetical protein
VAVRIYAGVVIMVLVTVGMVGTSGACLVVTERVNKREEPQEVHRTVYSVGTSSPSPAFARYVRLLDADKR